MKNNTKKEFTKKQLFEYDMIYKPLFKKIFGTIFEFVENSNTNPENYIDCIYYKKCETLEGCINLINSVFDSEGNGLSSCKLEFILGDKFYSFLDSYAEHLDFYRIILDNEIYLSDFRNFVRKYDKYIPSNKKCWYSITQRFFWYNYTKFSKMDRLDNDFIREFKDKLSWSSLSRNYTFDEDFLREMKDYVDWPIILKRKKNTPQTKIKESIYKEYIMEKFNLKEC